MIWLFLSLMFQGPGPHDHGARAASVDPDANIVVTINPEARVTAVLRRQVPTSTCGSPVLLRVMIVNEGFVTAPLSAKGIGEGSRNVAVEFDAIRLKGRNEIRELVLRPQRPGPTDLTVVFSISAELDDLAERDRINVLIACT